jgi:hypothetical protein
MLGVQYTQPDLVDGDVSMGAAKSAVSFMGVACGCGLCT